jgi:tRNA (adenine22-N1)-methyltransferase
VKLNQRLLTIAGFVPEGSTVVDIGTDHALLPIYLLQNKIAAQVIAGDLNPGPLEAARRNVMAADLENSINLRLGNGLEIVKTGEAEVCIIAGMGGGTIRDIIKNAGPKAQSLKQLILQPMGGSGALREWLVENGWAISAEDLVIDEGRLYEIIAARPGQEKTVDPVLVTIGPRLFDNKHPLLSKVISEEIKQNNDILSSLRLTGSVSGALKRDALEQRNSALERILKCL